MPEHCFRGGSLTVTGRVLDNTDISGWRPFLRIRNGVLDPVPGTWFDLPNRMFVFNVSRAVTQTLAIGRVEYEIYIEVPSGEVFVIEQGSLDVKPRI